ncbi:MULTISPECIES: hypothetical protein [Pseudanabaena]|uniref:CRISPR-associated protein n=2 Tax=Pseudanabaena TaxID=1152 RepID=L8N7H4_9CYAN|nr:MULTISPECIES: hypothetical protein [Pseudanabaena]ELS34183.1 hypothetical protein Pse7429DRAFT_0665 [Pseudanabaena biceps PCC 7429]MDG3493598.1 hypothetical protein [Pseudanabaena catenata USMAC16]
MNPFKRALFDPSRNLFLFIAIALIGLPFIANGIFDLVWNTGADWLKDLLKIKDKSTVQIAGLAIIIAIMLLIIYGTDFVSNVGRYLSRFFSPRGNAIAKVSAVTRDYAGLIAFMSARSDSPAEWAIRFHCDEGRNKTFQYCWLICTEKSVVEAENLVARLARERCLMTTSIFFGDYVIKNENAPDMSLLVPEEFVDDPNYIQRLIQGIYLDAESRGISESKIIADYTGGTKSMTAGMVIACASPNRHLEYIVQSDLRPIMEVDISYNMRPVRG